jgi:uncharacterized protein YdcH (DUF465 family)
VSLLRAQKGVAMEGHHHILSEEFPEYKEKIHTLKMSNAHFKNLITKWEEIDKQIARAESRIELMSEDEEEQLRKTRLSLKDQIYQMLRQSE